MKKMQSIHIFFILSLIYASSINIIKASTNNKCNLSFKVSQPNLNSLDKCSFEQLSEIAMNTSKESIQLDIFNLGNKELNAFLLLNLNLSNAIKLKISADDNSDFLINALLKSSANNKHIKKYIPHVFNKSISLLNIINFYEKNNNKKFKLKILNYILIDIIKNKNYYISINNRKINRYMSSLDSLTVKQLNQIKKNNEYYKDIETDKNIIENKNVTNRMIEEYKYNSNNSYINLLLKLKKKLKKETEKGEWKQIK